MAVLTFPTLFPTTVKWSLDYKTQTFTSPLSGTTQTRELPGARWRADLSYKGLNETQIRPLVAFIATMRGASGRTFLHDAGHPLPNGTIAGSAVVSGAGQTGATVNVTGFTGTLLAGDYIALPVTLSDATASFELKFVTADASGPGPISIEPPIRTSPNNGQAVIYNQAQVLMRLIDDRQLTYGRGGSPIYDINLSFIETFI